jgi:hypothetical protein
MSWLRLDDDFASHPKIAALTDRQFRVWMRVLCYCGKHQDPTVDRVAIREVKGLTSRSVLRFAQLELLDKSGRDYEVHDWPLYQPKDTTGAERQARWRARRNAASNNPRNGERNDSDRDENVTSRADAHARSRPLQDGTYVLDAEAHEERPPPPLEAPAANAYTIDEVTLLEAAEQWVRTEGCHLPSVTLYRRLVDDFGIKWPDEQGRLVELALLEQR